MPESIDLYLQLKQKNLHSETGDVILRNFSSEQGMTLVELIVVLAIVIIIGAILMPNFLTSTDKARLKSDIQSARVIDHAIKIYDAEQATPVTKTSMPDMLKALKDKGYLTAKEEDIQTDKASWSYGEASNGEKGILVNIAGCDEKIKKDVYNGLTPKEKVYVVGGVSAAASAETGN